MWSPWNGNVKNVQMWIDVACCKLCDDAKATISREIRGHYDDAYESALAHGAQPVDAHERAMGSLGDPYAARKGFREVHLTNGERHLVYPSTRLRLLMTASAAIMCVLNVRHPGSSEVITMSLFYTCYAGRLWLRGRQPIPRLVAYYMAFAVPLLLTALNAGRTVDPFGLVTVVLGVLAFALLFEGDLRVQRKLRRVAMRHES